ncbi:MAG: imidazole glycerol phosphate synthase subunit HisH [Spirochaetaceae bacterium]
MKIGVVDYEAGNLKSVETALLSIGAEFTVSDKPEPLLATDRLVFPGVGDAKAAMDVLRRSGLADAVTRFFETGKLILGICVGSQIVLDASEENDATCLGLVPGIARRFPVDLGLKVPHMGWNQVRNTEGHPLFEGIAPGTSFYFVHSYYPDPDRGEYRLGTTDYGITFAAGVQRENLMAVQFHPEKSGEAGLRLLDNFLAMSDR